MFTLYTMNNKPIPSEPETAADVRAARTQRNLQALDELVAIGMALTRLVQEQAVREVEMATRLNEPTPDFTVAIDRMARMVRRTVLLAEKLSEPAKAPEPVRPAEEVIEEIRRDLGIAAAPGSRRWKRRTPADVARLCVRAATLRPETGPFNLPMPPGRWECDNPLFGRDGLGDRRGRGEPPGLGP